MDWAEKEGISSDLRPTELRRDKVAIIGSGPAGLTAGYDLALKGFRPTIFESLPVAGGMLAAGIPEHRLPKKVLAREIEAIKRAGVEIKTNAKLGKDFTIDTLFREGFKAVFIATGAWKSMKMEIPGEDAQGVDPVARIP